MSSELNLITSLIARGCTSPHAYLGLSVKYKNSPFKRMKKMETRSKGQGFLPDSEKVLLTEDLFFLLKLNGKSIGGGGGVASGEQEGNEKVGRVSMLVAH